MVRFVPAYGVFYHGSFHPGGEAFEIEERDAEEMRKHGEVIMPEQNDPPKRGRPKRVE